MEFFIVLFFIGALAFIYWYFTENHDYWKKRKIVHLRALPLLGTSWNRFLFNKNQTFILWDIYRQFPSEGLVGGFINKTPELMVKDPEIVKAILVKDFNHFQDHGPHLNTERDPLVQHLFLSTGAKWRVLRQNLTPTFTSGKMRKMFPLILECGEEFRSHIRDTLRNGEVIEVKELMARFTTDVIGSCAFGIKMNSMKDDDSAFRRMGKKIFEPSIGRLAKLVLSLASPQLFELLKLKVFPVELDKFFIGLVKSIMESRSNRPSTRNDFVDLLMELKSRGFAKKDSETNFKITDELLTAQAFVFFAAGFETSSMAMSFALRELAYNKDVQEKLIREIDQVLHTHNGALSYDTLTELQYLPKVIDETLRMYPTAGVISRICTIPYSIPNTDIKIDKGVLVNIPVYAMHHDPAFFSDPEIFDPERFSEEGKQSVNPFVYLPFGAGPRICIGQRFARMQMMIGLISLLRQYTVEPNNKTNPKVEFSPTSFVLSSKDGVYLTIKPREGVTTNY